MLQSMRLQTAGHDLVIEQQQPCGIGKSYFSNQGWNLNLFLWKRSNHWTTREVPLPQQRKALLSHIPFQGPRDPFLVAEGKGQTSPRVCVCVCVCVYAKLLLLCPTLCHPMDCSPPGSTVHEILQARVLGWVAMPSFRGSS